MRNFKKILSVILAIAMISTMFVFTATAATKTTTYSVDFTQLAPTMGQFSFYTAPTSDWGATLGYPGSSPNFAALNNVTAGTKNGSTGLLDTQSNLQAYVDGEGTKWLQRYSSANGIFIVKFTAPKAGTYTAKLGGAVEVYGGATLFFYSGTAGAEGKGYTQYQNGDGTYGLNIDKIGDPSYAYYNEGGYFKADFTLEAGQEIVYAILAWSNYAMKYASIDVVYTVPDCGEGNHTYEWKDSNNTQHYQECSVCGNETTPASHDFSTGTCSTCNMACPHTTLNETTWVNDENGHHYRNCAVCNQAVPTSSVDCSSDTELEYEDDGHYQLCDYCDTEIPGTRETHTTAVSCTECAFSKVGYSADVTVSATTINLDESILYTVTVKGMEESFASYRLEFTYDPTYLTFDNTSTTNLPSDVIMDTETSGKIVLTGYGESKTLGTEGYAITVKFNAKAATETPTNVVLDVAKFSSQENAAASDLYATTPTNATKAITVRGVYDVDASGSTSGWVTGDETVAHGNDYTFNLSPYYTYNDLVVMMGTINVTESLVINEAAGTYTVKNVTDDITITVTSRTGKTYGVSYVFAPDEYSGDALGNANAQRDSDYTFTLPNDIPASTTAGTTYSLTSVTVNGATYSIGEPNGRTYTIPGGDITGAIVVNVAISHPEANQVTIELAGNAMDKGSLSHTSPVAKETDLYIDLNVSDTRYTYTVIAYEKGNKDNALTLEEDNEVANRYNLSGEQVTVNVVFEVTRTLVADCTVSEYVQLNETKVWLIKLNYNDEGTKANGIYKYNGVDMFWSSEYKAFCTLVIASAAPVAADVEAAITLVDDGTSADVDYTGDVNKTGNVDANDAQLVWNIYNGKMYTNMTTVGEDGYLPMEKFLRADKNGDGTVTVDDATAVVQLTVDVDLTAGA